MLAHLACLISLFHAAIILIVAELLRYRIVHEIAKLVGSCLWHQLEVHLGVLYVSEWLWCFAKLLVESIVLLIVLVLRLFLIRSIPGSACWLIQTRRALSTPETARSRQTKALLSLR